MSDGTARVGPIPCAQCGHPAIVAYDHGNGRYLSFCLCLEHAQQYQEVNQRTIDMLQQNVELAEDKIDDVFGLPRRVRPPRLPAARVNVHQVHIHGDNLGVVNTGTVGSIATNLTIINSHDAALAGRLKELTEAVLASTELDTAQKQEAAELLSEVTENAAKPAPRRRSTAAMNAIKASLERVLGNAANLATLWSAVAPYLG